MNISMLNKRRINHLLLSILTLTIMITISIDNKYFSYDKVLNNYKELKEEIGKFDVDCSLVQNLKQNPQRDKILNEMDEQINLGFEDETGSSYVVIQRPIFNCLEATDPYLTKAIRRELLHEPVKPKTRSKNSTILFKNRQEMDVIEMVYDLNLYGGFFIEAGAGDCSSSITQTLEDNFQWSGLLVEAVPEFYKKCLKKERNVWMANTCLATQNKPHYSHFNLMSSGSFSLPSNPKIHVKAMQGFSGDEYGDRSIELQCLPIMSLLFSLGNPTVNLFVLDIEGFELAVLRTINFKKIDVEVFSIETDLAGKFQKDSSRQAIIDIMVENGYTRFDHRNDFNILTNSSQNDLFVRNDIVVKYNVKQLK